jgi:hypothetical protein
MEEGLLMQAGHAYEQATEWHAKQRRFNSGLEAPGRSGGWASKK